MVRTNGHTAGTPCVGFSTLGKLEKDADASIECTMAWCALVLLLLFPFVLHENATGFSIDILKTVFDHFYDN